MQETWVQSPGREDAVEKGKATHSSLLAWSGEFHGLYRPWRHKESDMTGCSLEGLMLKLKLQYFGHLMRRVDSLEKTLILGEIGGRRRRG